MIRVENLWKVFRLYHDPKDRLKEILLRRSFSREINALKEISFTVKNGETLGIIGENGAGKSTLLKILTGILLPSRGEVNVDGKITGLLELGTGFNAEFTGLKNIYMNGLLIGMTKEDVDKKLESIIEFTELGEFIQEPIKTYSSGMLMRLGFSIAIHAEPAAFVIDEALAVGDAFFQQKCMKRINEFRQAGGSIVFVSHDMNAVKVLCDRAMLLSHGTNVEEGTPEKVINTYNFLLAKKTKGEEIKFEDTGDRRSYGTFRVEIKKVEFLNASGDSSEIFVAGEGVKIRVHMKANEDTDNVVVGILIRDRYGQDIFGTNTYYLDRVISLKQGETPVYEFDFNLNIGIGKYTLTTAIHRDGTHIEESYHWYDSILKFEVVGPKDNIFIGLSKLDIGLEIKNPSTT
jgi:lipopolysaccharide transport system ATP-binding protein